MKIVVILLVICASQASASFFEEFRGAMYSVQDSFGRLVTDVYADVSQTIGCTILAVKQVLALDGTFHESSDYNRKCRGQAPATSPVLPIIDKENGAYSYIDTQNANHELDSIEMKFKTETDRLMAISELLKREVDNIPLGLKLKFRSESVPQDPIGSIWHSLKILHDVEHSNKNYARASEIHQVLDEALHIMNIKTTDANKSDDDKIKTIVKDLEKDSKDALIEADKQFKEWTEEELKKEEDIKSFITKDQNDSPSLINTDNNVSTKVNNIKFSREVKTYTEAETTEEASAEQINTLSPEFEEFQNLLLAQFGPKDSDSQIAAVDEATRLIQDSELRNKVFDSLAKAESASTDLFENPNLFINNFGEY